MRGLARQGLFVLLFAGCIFSAAEKGIAQIIDGATISLSPSRQYFSSDRQGGGEFGLNLAPDGVLFQMQSGASIVLTGQLISYVLTGSVLTADTSSNEGLASAEFSHQSAAGVTATLTMEAKVWTPVVLSDPIVLLVAEATGPVVAAEIPGLDDQIQVQVPMRVTGGELMSGALTGLTMSDFTATYTFDSFGIVNPHVDDFQADIFFVQGTTAVQFGSNPPPDGMGLDDLRNVSQQWLRCELHHDVAPVPGDQRINLADWAVISKDPLDMTQVQAFTAEWLKLGTTLDDFAPNGGDGRFDLVDFAAMSQNWIHPSPI